jgi:hypothetical protein
VGGVRGGALVPSGRQESRTSLDRCADSATVGRSGLGVPVTVEPARFLLLQGDHAGSDRATNRVKMAPAMFQEEICTPGWCRCCVPADGKISAGFRCGQATVRWGPDANPTPEYV